MVIKMGTFKFGKTPIDGLYVVQPHSFCDNRGYFCEMYNKADFFDAGLTMEFVQDNESESCAGTLRGMHFQIKKPQGKLVRVVSGSVYDVAVDIRPESKTFGRWHGVLLSAENKTMFYIPEGFAHGFIALEDNTIFSYKCSNFYDKSDEGAIFYGDPDLNINWTDYYSGALTISEKDLKNPLFKESLGEKI